MENTNEKITTVCIATCDRPESLEKALTGLIGNLTKYVRTPRILVVDDSENPESSEKTKKICSIQQAGYQGKIECIDRADRAEMTKILAKKKGVPEEVTHFALCGDKASPTTVGAVRNTCLLKTRGEKILTIDDDVIFSFLSPAEEQPLFFSIENPNKYWFLKNDEMPSSSLFKPIEVDFLGAHENILGKRVEEILGENTPEYIKGMQILDTFVGSYGDSPMASHITLLSLPQVQKNLKNISFNDYQENKKTSRIATAPLSPTVYQGTMCISMAMGIDNRKLVPLFMPVGRAEDLTFGTIRFNAFPTTLSMHIPILIGHQRPIKETRATTFDSVLEMTKVNKVISALVNEIENADVNPADNLQIIGDKFIKLSLEPLQIFRLIMESQCEKTAKEATAYFNNILQNSPDMPDFWVNDMKLMIQALNSPDPKLFMSGITKDLGVDSMAILKKRMNLYGQLLKEWPKLIQ